MNRSDALSPDLLLAEMMLERRPRVLVVDDQPVLLHSMAALFGADHDVSLTTQGEQVLALALQRQPDLILLDVVMPGTSGYDVCRQLKADPQTRDIPVIFLTAQCDAESEALCFGLGAVDFIAKPFHAEVVRARVRTHLTLKQQRDLLRRWVFVDGLTGIANRRHFDERLQTEWGRAERTGKPLSLLMLDVDHFKDFNDRLGHQAGDDCLRLVARAVTSAIRRPGDLTARYGGEEFVCLLPDTDEAGAVSLAEAVRQRVPAEVAASGLHEPAWPQVTVCIGVATWRADHHRSAADLIFQADHNLYRAKAGGRDAVCHGAVAAGARLN